NGDSQVDGVDLGQLLAAWGGCRPVITAVSPSGGSVLGGTPITISGRFFTGATGVRIGGTPALNVVPVSATTITAVTPSGASGPAAVSVTANGTGTLAGAFTYRPASIFGISPSAGPTNGGTSVTIVGEFMSGVTSVWFGTLPAQSFTSSSPAVLTAVTPPSAAGPALDVRVVTSAGAAVATSAFMYRAASILGVAPAAGPVNGGTSVTITGEFLSGATGVWFGATPAESFTSASDTMLTAISPRGTAGTAVDIRVATSAGVAEAAAAFTYRPASILDLPPPVGPPNGGTAVTITGEFLSAPTAVWFGESPALSFTRQSSTSLRATAPPGTAGTTVDGRVVTRAGTAVAPAAYSYVNIVVPPWAELIEAFPDPQIVTDGALRSAIVASGLAWRVRHAATQVEMLLVPPGSFPMGCSRSLASDCNAHENPVHPVALTSPFYLGRFEVTQAEWQAWTGSNPSQFASEQDSPVRPVEGVSWLTAQQQVSAAGMRLPTEAEWEFACRAGTTTAFGSGSDDDSSVAAMGWYAANSGNETRPVGTRSANRLGLHDMHGNVWEWVSDWYGSTYYLSSPPSNPPGPPSGSLRLLRGGAFDSFSNGLRSSFRFARLGTLVDGSVGVRVARDP
ncbi:MAG: SUMF1/EgtB/PvdO family nonheme iron enzyme, partial [Phycisphaerales bacterium]